MSLKLSARSSQANLFQKFIKLNKLKRPKLSVLLMLGFFGLLLFSFIPTFQSGNFFGNITAQAATCTWSGNNSGDFSDSGNWSACPTGSGAPENGDIINFFGTASEYNLNNDLIGVQFGGVTIDTLNSNDYFFGGDTLDVNGTINFSGIGSNSFNFDTDVLSCGISGSGKLSVGFGLTLYSGCNDNSSNTFSGEINGDGTFRKEGNGLQTLVNATTGSNLTVVSAGYFMAITANTQINGPYENSFGGTLVTEGAVFNGSVSHIGGGLQLYPSSNGIDFNGGYDFSSSLSSNIAFDAGSTSSYASMNINSGNTILNDGAVSMRFFGTYIAGNQYTIVKTSGSGSISGEFANLLTGQTAIFQGFTNAGVTKSVEVELEYTGSSVIATILNVFDIGCSSANLNTNTGNFSSKNNVFGPANYLARL